MQISFAVTTKLISSFVFATWIVQYLFFLNVKFRAPNHLQWLHSLVCVRPGQNPNCWFSHAQASEEVKPCLMGVDSAVVRALACRCCNPGSNSDVRMWQGSGCPSKVSGYSRILRFPSPCITTKTPTSVPLRMHL